MFDEITGSFEVTGEPFDRAIPRIGGSGRVVGGSLVVEESVIRPLIDDHIESFAAIGQVFAQLLAVLGRCAVVVAAVDDQHGALDRCDILWGGIVTTRVKRDRRASVRASFGGIRHGDRATHAESGDADAFRVDVG